MLESEIVYNDNIMDLIKDLESIQKGDVITDPETLRHYSGDASVFRIMPRVVVAPKTIADIKALVNYVREHKRHDTSLSLTVRSGGTDMGGGPLSDSIVVDMNKYLNKLVRFGKNSVTVQPGMFYHDLEPLMNKRKVVYPSYPASKSIASLGGIVSNNSGGEMSLRYGQTVRYVESLKVVLADGNEYALGEITKTELAKKMKQGDFEGQVYRSISQLLSKNHDRIQKAKPHTSKNSTGYLLWDVMDSNSDSMNLAKIFVGAQGTLGIITEATLRLVPIEPREVMAVIYLDDNHLRKLAEIVNIILQYKPTALESYDDKTLRLALKYAPQIAHMISKEENIIHFGLNMIPDFLLMFFTRGLPKLVLMAEFTGKSRSALDKTMSSLTQALRPYHVPIRQAHSAEDSAKYWTIRRQSFNLLRKKIKGKQTVPFIDDIIVNPEYLPEFLPKLNDILRDYPQLTYTIAGHVGNGNFHIIPLMDLTKPHVAETIRHAADRVYDLVFQYGGSMSAEHNDGMIRGQYLEQMYGRAVMSLFRSTKIIFDPDNIFNPHKKTQATWNYALKWLKKDNEHEV